MRTIELDTVINEGESAQGVIAELTQGTDVVGEVVTMNGPAGGNPVVRYTGTEDELIKVAWRYGEDTVTWVREQLL